MNGDVLKRVLLILPLEPHAEGVGSQKRAAAHLSALIGRARVHLVVLDSDTTSVRAGDPDLYAQCETFVVLKYTRRPRRAVLNTFPFFFLAELFDSTRSRRLPSSDLIREAFSGIYDHYFDAGICFKVLGATILDHAMEHIPLKIGRRIVDFDDIESMPDYSAIPSENHGLEQSLIDRLVRFRQRRSENHFLSSFDSVWVCSRVDQSVLLARQPKAEICVVPNSVKLMRVGSGASSDDIRLLFVGKMSYEPNHEGIVWFVNEVLPLIKRPISQRVRLTIVGFEPRPEVIAFEALGDIVVTGKVEQVDPYYHDCDIAIAPIRTGGGTRIKILEAMSYCRPVVSTTKGAEGIDINPGENVMIGDEPEAFARACIELISNAESRHRVACGGRKLVEERYSDSFVGSMVYRAALSGTSVE